MHAVLTHKVYEDGYKWSKCHRRRVVRGEYISHYYRCRKANCITRRKIICFPNGKITKIKYDGDIHNQRKPQHLELVVCLKKILIKEKCIKKCMNLLGKKTPKTTTFPSCGSISTSLTNWNEQNMFGK